MYVARPFQGRESTRGCPPSPRLWRVRRSFSGGGKAPRYTITKIATPPRYVENNGHGAQRDQLTRPLVEKTLLPSGKRRGGITDVVPYDPSTFHDELHALELRHVADGIACNRNQV